MAHLTGDPFFGTRPLEPHEPGGLFKSSLKPKADTKTDYNTLDGKVQEYGEKAALVVVKKSACLLCLPALAGIAILCLFSLFFWNSSDLCWGVLVGCLFCGLVMCCVGWKGGLPAHRDSAMNGYSSTFMKVLGGCVIFTSLLGLLLGAIGYFSYLKNYEIFSGSTHYEGVSPNANPASYRDAGVISFTDDAHIDHYKSAAYRKGDTYCAAPIVGDTNDDDPVAGGTSGNYVGFWAVGVDCCGKGYFRCGEVFSTSTHGGLVVLDASPQFSESIPMYKRAAEESAARAGLAMAAEPIFIKWSANIDTQIRTFREDCKVYVLVATFGIISMMSFVVLCCLFAKNSKISRGGLLDVVVGKFYSGDGNPEEFLHENFHIQQDPRNTRFRGHGERLSRTPFN